MNFSKDMSYSQRGQLYNKSIYISVYKMFVLNNARCCFKTFRWFICNWTRSSKEVSIIFLLHRDQRPNPIALTLFRWRKKVSFGITNEDKLFIYWPSHIYNQEYFGFSYLCLTHLWILYISMTLQVYPTVDTLRSSQGFVIVSLNPPTRSQPNNGVDLPTCLQL